MSPTRTRIDLSVLGRFKWVFGVLVVLTVLSLGAAILLSIWGKDNESTGRIVETCTDTYQMGFAAIVGMLGGKLLR